MSLQKSPTIITAIMELRPPTIMSSFLFSTLALLFQHTEAVFMDIQQIRANISWMLKTVLFLVTLTVLQGFCTFITTGHPWLSHSNHQEYSMATLWEIQCHLTRPLHSSDGYLICLVNLAMESKNLIFPYIHWK